MITEYMVELSTVNVVLKVGQKWKLNGRVLEIVCFLGYFANKISNPKELVGRNEDGWCETYPIKFFAKNGTWISSAAENK